MYDSLSLSPTSVCKCVALAPLSKNLTCASECDVMKDNVSVVWNFYKDDGDTNITFRYGLDPVLHAGTSVKTYEGVKVTADGVLDIEPVSAQGHEGHYSCRAVFSNGTQCGRTDEVDVEVIILCKCWDSQTYFHNTMSCICLLYGWLVGSSLCVHRQLATPGHFVRVGSHLHSCTCIHVHVLCVHAHELVHVHVCPVDP